MFDGSFAGPGRPKGSKTKRLFNTRSLIGLLEHYDHEPIIEQINMARDPDCPYAVRYKINELFIKLIYPQIRAVQHSGTIEHNSLNINMNIAESPVQESVTHEQTIDATMVPATQSVATSVEAGVDINIVAKDDAS